jgi:hypothetical protein
VSFTTKRTAIASALSAVPDVKGHAHRPSTMTPGDAWPVLGPLTRAQGIAFTVQWRVRVVLPQEEEAASVWLDEHWDALFYALAPHGYVSQSAPVMLAAGGGELYALEISLLAEE